MPRLRIPYPSPRVSQLDAEILDNELFSLLKQQLSDAFSLLSTKKWSFSQHPDLWSLILKLTIFKITTLRSGSSYGFQLQNLKLSNSKGALISKKIRYFLLLTIFGDYLFKKFSSYLYTLEESAMSLNTLADRVKAVLLRYRSIILKSSEDVIKILELLNFVLFLIQGRYPSLLYRVFGITVTPVVADLLKFNGSNVNFEFQNRQLVWNVMTEFLVFILPLLQLRKWKKAMNLVLPKGDSQLTGYSESAIVTRFTDLPISLCAMCIEFSETLGIKASNTHVTNPYVTNCGHVFCYICLAARFNAIEQLNEAAEACPRCNQKLTTFSEFGLDDVDPDAIMVKYQEVELPDTKADEDQNETPPMPATDPHSSDSESSDEEDDDDDVGQEIDADELFDDNDDDDIDDDEDFDDDDDDVDDPFM